MKRFLSIVLLGVTLSQFTLADNFQDKAKDQVKYILAKDKFAGRDFYGALQLFYDLLSKTPENIDYNYYAGECLIQLRKYNEANDYIAKVVKTNPNYSKNVHLDMGICLHRSGKLDEALAEFNTYKASLSPKQLKENDVNDYIQQIANAKELMAKPVNVKIENMGDLVNSKYDDYAPSITADGKTMIFTSRRDDTKGGGVDAEADNKYFEDVYITTQDESGKWADAEPIKGSVNSEGHDASLSISPDGHQIFLYKNEVDITRSGDIFISKSGNNGKWSAPHPIGPTINSSYFETSASLTADGNTLYFVSERKEKTAVGNADIYVVKKISKTEWGIPVNIGPVINTIEDELSVFIHPDGKTLFFSSRGHNSMGGLDIFKAVMNDKGIWSKPENLGYPINTVNDDLHFVVTTDNKTAYYSSYDPNKGIGERDIYKIDLSNYTLTEGQKIADGPQISILKGDILDTFVGSGMESEIIISDESGKEVAKTTSSPEGNYFITLEVNKKYSISVNKEGYKPVKEDFEMKTDKSGTYTLVKHLLLNRIDEKK